MSTGRTGPKATQAAADRRRFIADVLLKQAGPAGLRMDEIIAGTGATLEAVGHDMRKLKAAGVVSGMLVQHVKTWVLKAHMEEAEALAEERRRAARAEVEERRRNRDRRRHLAERTQAQEAALQKFMKTRQSIVREWPAPVAAPGPRSVFELGAV